MPFCYGLENDADDAGTLNGGAEHFLVSEAGPGDPARQDPAFFSLEFLQQIGVFEINEIDLVFAESADFRFGDPPFRTAFSILHSHVFILL